MSEPIVVVSGLPRSGTSMMMQALEAGGITCWYNMSRDGGPLNPRGFYEFAPPRATKGDRSYFEELPGLAIKILAGGIPKLPAGYLYKILLMRRADAPRAASELNRLTVVADRFDRQGRLPVAIPTAERIVADGARLLAGAKAVDLPMLEVAYEDVIRDPSTAMARVAAFLLPRELDVAAMSRAVEPALCHHGRPS